MSTDTQNGSPVYTHIFHPSNLSSENELAFAHALKLGLEAQSRVTQFYVETENVRRQDGDCPDVLSMLVRWNLLPEDATEDMIWDTGLKFSHVQYKGADPVDAALFHLERDPADLVVLATHGTKGLPRWLKPAVAQPISHGTKAMTLFIPVASSGFIDAQSGQVSLNNVLIPAALEPSAQPAVDAAVEMATLLGSQDAVFHLLHIGEDETFPVLGTPTRYKWRWKQIQRPGQPIKVITEIAAELSASLVVLSTEGQKTFIELLTGSTTDQIVRGVNCPTLSVPVVETGRI